MNKINLPSDDFGRSDDWNLSPEEIKKIEQSFRKLQNENKDYIENQDFFSHPLIWPCVIRTLLNEAACEDFAIIANRYLKLKADDVKESYLLFLQSTTNAHFQDVQIKKSWRFNVLCAILYDAYWKKDSAACEYVRLIFSIYQNEVYQFVKRIKSINENSFYEIAKEFHGSYITAAGTIGILLILGVPFSNQNSEHTTKNVFVCLSNFIMDESNIRVQSHSDREALNYLNLHQQEFKDLKTDKNFDLEFASHARLLSNIMRAEDYNFINRLGFNLDLQDFLTIYPKNLNQANPTDLELGGYWYYVIRNLIADVRDKDNDMNAFMFDMGFDSGTNSISRKTLLHRLDTINTKEESRILKEKVSEYQKQLQDDNMEELEALSLEKDKLIETISDLKMKYADLKGLCSSQAESICSLKKELSEKESILSEKMDREDEIAILKRNYEDLLEAFEADVNERDNDAKMLEYLSNKRICIIGGNPNLTNKLKVKFPNWTYISPDNGATRTETTSVISSYDYVFFDTDYMSHALYFKYINKLRLAHQPFGYLHSTNLEILINEIYTILRREQA